MYNGEFYFEDKNFKLIKEDTFKALKNFQEKSFDMIFADPPYFLSNNGITCSSGKMVCVNKGEWDKPSDVESKHSFNRKWINECYRVLKDDGTIWISGTLHNIYSIGMALEEEEFKIINNITWQKTNPPPNLACKTFTHSTETILWAKKQGKHPTQKPLEILERIILASSTENDLILDPFCGSGTTGIAAYKLNRKFIGIDNSQEYLDLSIRRFEHIHEVRNNKKND